MKKIEVARIQIETAIDHLINDQNFACGITLAGAAEEMLGNLLAAQGKNHILADLHPWYESTYQTEIKFSDLAKGANFVRDELKHGHTNSDPDFEIEVTKAMCTQMIQRAMINYPRVAGAPSPRMIEAARWINQNYQELYAEWRET